MLLDVLYNIKSVESLSSSEYEYVLGLLPDCGIYKAHFPGFPITPGACILQIALELAAEAYGAGKGMLPEYVSGEGKGGPCKEVRLKQAGNIRFMAPLVPSEQSELKFTLSQGNAGNVTVTVSDDRRTYATMNLRIE